LRETNTKLWSNGYFIYYRFKNKKDENPKVENVTYYRVLKDIIELDYYGHSEFVLFRRDWFESEQDHFGLTLVNF